MVAECGEGVEIQYQEQGENKTATTNSEGRYSIWIEDTLNTTISIKDKAIKGVVGQVAGYRNINPSVRIVSLILNMPNDSGAWQTLNSRIRGNLKQIIETDFGKTLEDGVTAQYYEDVELVLENGFTELKKTYRKNVFLSYITESATAGFNDLFDPVKYPGHDGQQKFYDIFLVPESRNAKNAIQRKSTLIKEVLDPINDHFEIGASDILAKIYEKNDTFMARTFSPRTNNFNENQIAVSLDQDQVIDITVADQEDVVTPVTSDPSTSIPTVGGDGHITVDAKIEIDGTPTGGSSNDTTVKVYLQKTDDSPKKLLGTIGANQGSLHLENRAIDGEDSKDGEWYYLIYEFKQEAWEQGYSLQEYEVDSNTDNGVNTVTYTMPIDGINYTEETALDTNYDKTKIEAKVGSYHVYSWEDADGNTTYNHIDSTLKLKRRQTMELTIKKEICGIKIVLSDGSVFLEEKEDHIHWSIDEIKKIISMDDELMHGATVYVEYDITIENAGEIEAKKVTIMDALDNQEGMYLTYDPNTALITNTNKINQDFGWTSMDPSNLTTDVVDNTTRFQNARNLIQTTISSVPAKQSDGSSGKASVKLVTSQVITTDTDPVYQNEVQILSYQNNEHKRNGIWNTNINNSYSRAGTETTHTTSQTVVILPPFGNNWFDLVKTKNVNSIYKSLW